MIILVDADVISHFMRAGKIVYLTRIFDTPIRILDIVYKELEQWQARRTEVDNLINYKLIEVVPFPQDDYDISKEYFQIKKLRYYGDGEAACMSYAKFTSNIVGSNNLKDIKNYCELHNIEYITTMDFLKRAIVKGVMTERECDDFLKKNITNGRNPFPVEKMVNFQGRDISHIA